MQIKDLTLPQMTEKKQNFSLETECLLSLSAKRSLLHSLVTTFSLML